MTISKTTGSFMKRLHDDTRPNPTRDWLILCALSVVAFTGIVLWNVWAFNTVAQGGVIGAPSPAVAPAVSRSSLDTVHSIFASRAAEEMKYETGVYRFVDPSQ